MSDLNLQLAHAQQAHLPQQVILQRFVLSQGGFQRRKFIIITTAADTSILVLTILIDLLHILLPVHLFLSSRLLFLFFSSGFVGLFADRHFGLFCCHVALFLAGIGVDIHRLFQYGVFNKRLFNQFFQFGA